MTVGLDELDFSGCFLNIIDQLNTGGEALVG